MSDQELVKKTHTSDVMPTGGQKGGQLGTIFGIEAGDIRIPYVYLIRSGAKNAILANGKRPTVGQLFHSTKKEAYDELDVLIAHASKGTSRETKQDGSEEMVPCYRAIVIPVDDPTSVFMISFKGSNLYVSWKDFISELSAKGLTNLDVVVKLRSKEIETKYGMTNAMELVISGEDGEIMQPATEEQREMMLSVSNKLGNQTMRARDEEEAPVETEVVPTDVDEVLNDDKKKRKALSDALPDSETEVDLDTILKD